MAASGDRIEVRPGIYIGQVNVTKPLTINSPTRHAARLVGTFGQTGFSIRANDITINGFYVEQFNEGIGNFGPNARHRITIINNHIYRTSNGIWANGDDWLVANNEIERLIQTSAYSDCNYIVFFGRNHVYRQNFTHGTNMGDGITSDICPAWTLGQYDPGPCSHVDALQTFSNNGETAQNILIDGNYFGGIGQGIIIQDWGFTNAMRDITIQNNVFAGVSWRQGGGTTGTPWGIIAEAGFGTQNLIIENNLFHRIQGAAIGARNGTSGAIRGNIMYECSVAYTIQGNVTTEYNILYDTWPGFDTFANDYHDMNPLIVNANSLLGSDGRPFTGDDGYQPQDYSGGIDGCPTCTSQRDIFKNSRPRGNIHDVGPTESFIWIDTDGDGIADPIEISLGTDPNDPFDFPILSAASRAGVAASIAFIAAVFALKQRRRKFARVTTHQ